MRIVVLSKRQYTNKDVIDDRYGRLWEIPMALACQVPPVIAEVAAINAFGAEQ